MPAGQPAALSLYRSYLQLDRRVWWLAAARGINTMGFSIVMPFMAMYLVEKRHVSGASYGLIYLVAGIAAAASHSYGALFFAAAAIMGVAAVATSRVRGLGDGHRPHAAAVAAAKADLRAILVENRAFLVYLGLVFLGSMMTVQLFATLSVYA